MTNSSFLTSWLIKEQKKLCTFCVLLFSIIIIQSCQPTTDGGGMTNDTNNGNVKSINFSPKIPVDVDPAIQSRLKEEGNIYALNQAFNRYSWDAFVAINWPRDTNGNPTPNFTDKGTATWLGWKEAFQVYREDGKKPAPWGSPRTASGLGLHADVLNDANARAVLSTKTPTMGKNIADEVDQAFAGELYDQNGNIVVYEVLMNEAEYNYIMDNGLYNINGQLAFTRTNPVADFPKGNYKDGTVGAVEIKFAWKILESNDIKERYFISEGYIENQETKELEKKTLGMIGMHISQKTPTGKQWVWSTFEQIDIIDQNTTTIGGDEVVIHPSLRDPDCEICPANVDLSSDTASLAANKHGDYWDLTTDKLNWYRNSSVRKTQVKRMVDIPMRVEKINAEMQAYFKSVGSVWQYYRLVDTQYPLDQNVAPAPNSAENFLIPESVINKPGGKPNLALLTNMTMETFFQAGNEDASNLIENYNGSTNFQIFGTESCMGCHSSAGIYNSIGPKSKSDPTLVAKKGGQLSADFSWLMGKAKWLDNIPVTGN